MSTEKELKEEIEYNIKICIEGIKLKNKNLEYHIDCLIREVNKKRNMEVKRVIENTYEEMECDDPNWNRTIKRVQNHMLEELGFLEDESNA